jgi:hypothetical protein
MEKISWTDRASNKIVLCRMKEERNILHTVKGRIEVTGRRGRRRKKLLDDLKATKGYWILKEEALDRTPWSTVFGSGGGAVVSQTTGAGFCSTRISLLPFTSCSAVRRSSLRA